MAELRYYCELLNANTGNIQSVANRLNISLTQASTLVSDVQEELRFTITRGRLVELQRLLNPQIGVRMGAVGKRKYVRKTQLPLPPQQVPEPVAAPKDSDGFEQPAEMYGLCVPIGTIIRTSPLGSGGSLYRITKITSPNSLTLQPCTNQGKDSGRSTEYSIKSLNSELLKRRWTLLNETPEFLKYLKNYSNVVLAKDIKRFDAQKTDGDRTLGHASYMLDLDGGYRIPFTPGFTGNCQLTVIGSMNALLAGTTDLPKQLKEIHKVAGRQLLLCDVRHELVAKIEEKLPKDWIHQKTPYKSSNKSDMVLMLINISK